MNLVRTALEEKKIRLASGNKLSGAGIIGGAGGGWRNTNKMDIKKQLEILSKKVI